MHANVSACALEVVGDGQVAHRAEACVVLSKPAGRVPGLTELVRYPGHPQVDVIAALVRV